MTEVITVRKKMQQKTIPEHIRASGIIPVLAYDEDDFIFLMDDCSIGFGFLCDPISGADEKTQERFQGFLNQDYPSKTVMQFVLFRSPDITDQMYRMIGLRDGFTDPILTTVIRERVKWLSDHTMDRMTAKTDKGTFDNGIIHDLKLFITVKVPIKSNLPTDKEISSLSELRTKVRSSLSLIGLHPRELTAAMYIRAMNTMLNWGKQASWHNDSRDWDKDRPICEQVFDYDTDLHVEPDEIRLGSWHAKVLSAKKMPDVMYFGDSITYAGDLSGANGGIKENYMIVSNVLFPEVEKAKGHLERKRQITVNQAYGPMLKFVPVLADKKNDFDLMYESINQGAKPVKISYTMVIFAPTKQRAQAASVAAQGIWRENRFQLMEDKFVSLPMFINSLPFCTDRQAIKDLFRYKTMTTEHAIAILPIFGEWKGTGTFHAALMSRNGQIMSLSLHDSDTNKNLVIAAESGSGKSFLTNELIFSYLSEGAQVWVIDAGKSYHKLSEMLEGDFLHFEEGTGICLNPFELVKNYEDEEDAIVSLVCAMASAKGLLDEYQIASLRAIMSELWAKQTTTMTVDSIADRCLMDDDRRVKDIGTQLFAFTKNGAYGKYFGYGNNVKFKNRFTVLELDELNGRKHLRQVVLLQLIYQIQQEVFLGERNRKKLVIIDEAWDLLKEGEVGSFMEHAYRKFRKYGGSVAIATQSINDLYENPVGRAIAENSSSFYLLGQKSDTVDLIQREGRLSLSEGGFSMLKTVHTTAGVYAEIFVKAKRGIGIGRLIVSEFQKLLYSTDARDVHAIEKYLQANKGNPNYTIVEAIREVMRDRGIKE